MSKSFEGNLTVELTASAFLSGLLLAAHAGAAVMAGLATLPSWLRLGVWAALGVSLYRTLRLHGRRTAPRAIRELVLDSGGQLALHEVGGRTWQRAQVLARFVHPWLTVLLARPAGRRRAVAVVIAFDAAETGAFTRLRARLARPRAAD